MLQFFRRTKYFIYEINGKFGSFFNKDFLFWSGLYNYERSFFCLLWTICLFMVWFWIRSFWFLIRSNLCWNSNRYFRMDSTRSFKYCFKHCKIRSSCRIFQRWINIFLACRYYIFLKRCFLDRFRGNIPHYSMHISLRVDFYLSVWWATGI